MKKIIFLAILICVFLACSKEIPQTAQQSPQEKEEANKKDREKTANTFQAFIDSRYPGWKVKGWRLDETVKSEADSDIIEKTFYYLLITKDSKDRTIFVVSAGFQMADGKDGEVIFEPASKTVKTLKDKKIVERERKRVEELEEASQDNEPPDPQV